MRIPFLTNWLIRREMRDTSLTMLMHSHLHIHDDMNILKGQIKELVAMNRRRELLVVAADGLANKFDDSMLALHVAPLFSQAELFPLLELLKAAGRHEAAAVWEEYHKDSLDDDEIKDAESKAEPVSN